jgi:hypothetical protein
MPKTLSSAKRSKATKSDSNKFTFEKKPINTKARFKTEQIETFQIRIPKRNASVNEANKFLDETMAQLFATYAPSNNTHKMYQTTFKLSDGRWYSSKYFEGLEQDHYPDLTDEQYHVNHDLDLVEHININMVTIHGAKITTHFNPLTK